MTYLFDFNHFFFTLWPAFHWFFWTFLRGAEARVQPGAQVVSFFFSSWIPFWFSRFSCLNRRETTKKVQKNHWNQVKKKKIWFRFVTPKNHVLAIRFVATRFVAKKKTKLVSWKLVSWRKKNSFRGEKKTKKTRFVAIRFVAKKKNLFRGDSFRGEKKTRFVAEKKTRFVV